MKSVFITGYNGFVGQYLHNNLSVDHNIIGLSHSTETGSEQHIGNNHYYQGSVTNTDLIYMILAAHKPEYIVHLAAKTSGWFDDPKQLLETNIFGTVGLYNSVVKLYRENGYNPRILYVGSSEAYGNTTDASSVTEGSPFFPINPYGASKASADCISYSYARSKKLNIVIARPFTHTGPMQKKGFFVPDMASQIVQYDSSPTVGTIFVGNLDAIRDYLDVNDVVGAYRLLLQYDYKPGETFNISSGKGVKVSQILNQLIEISGNKIDVQIDKTRFRPSEVPIMVGNSSKLIEATGWTPKIGLHTTLVNTLEYWRHQLKDGDSSA